MESVLRRTPIIAGSVLAAVAAAGALAVTGSAEAPSGQTIKVVEKGGTEKFVDVAPKAKGFAPGAGDAFLFSSPLLDAANKRVGKLDVRCDFTTGGRTARGICQGVFSLPGGDLLLAARLSTASSVKGAIVGGTGAYAGARGTFTSVDRPGGDNAPSDDTITLLP
jgi:hypothetical protein